MSFNGYSQKKMLHVHACSHGLKININHLIINMECEEMNH